MGLEDYIFSVEDVGKEIGLNVGSLATCIGKGNPINYTLTKSLLEYSLLTNEDIEKLKETNSLETINFADKEDQIRIRFIPDWKKIKGRWMTDKFSFKVYQDCATPVRLGWPKLTEVIESTGYTNIGLCDRFRHGTIRGWNSRIKKGLYLYPEDMQELSKAHNQENYYRYHVADVVKKTGLTDSAVEKRLHEGFILVSFSDEKGYRRKQRFPVSFKRIRDELRIDLNSFNNFMLGVKPTLEGWPPITDLSKKTGIKREKLSVYITKNKLKAQTSMSGNKWYIRPDDAREFCDMVNLNVETCAERLGVKKSDLYSWDEKSLVPIVKSGFRRKDYVSTVIYDSLQKLKDAGKLSSKNISLLKEDPLIIKTYRSLFVVDYDPDRPPIAEKSLVGKMFKHKYSQSEGRIVEIDTSSHKPRFIVEYNHEVKELGGGRRFTYSGG